MHIRHGHSGAEKRNAETIGLKLSFHPVSHLRHDIHRGTTFDLYATG